ncbi:MAG TPA: penicillin-binding protein 1C [Sandaracinaceae bacterium LLY-WYZ-13_1]|nr:penicillin-binding protein 1C [Sandaracinaceae bacterium LLY-WYZ-13_1]
MLERAEPLPRGGTGDVRPERRRASAVKASRWLRRASLSAVLLAVASAAVPAYPAARLSRRALRSTRVLARDGRPLWERRSAVGGYGRWVPLDAMDDDLVAATLSGEDAHFRWHPGIEPAGVVRALWLNLRGGRLAYGGSTITQQLAGLLTPRPRTLAGKAAEAWDALRLERTLDKDAILEHYLNRAYYGRNAYGVEAAAQRFFGRSARDLTLDQAALLAILPRGPSAYDPTRHPEAARRRRAHVLRHMAARGWIAERDAERAAARPIALADPTRRPRARHLLDHLVLTDRVTPGAPAVRTTLDLDLQRRLEARVRMHLLDVRDRAVRQAGVVVLDNATGEVRAMVGSRRYGERAVDGAVNATTASRHPGSALKPFVYALAFERGDRPSTPVLDVPTEWRDYHPRGLDRRHRGLVSVREALGSSLNVPAVRTAERLGIADLTAWLRRLGMTTIDPDPRHHGLSLALGGAPVRLLDLAVAYATLARGGVHRPARFVAGEPLPGTRVLSAASAYLVTDVLADPRARRAEFGLETPLELPFDVAVKTGTSQAFCDNVVVGYTPEVTVAVWVGNFDGEPMHGLLSMSGAAPLFRDAMLAAMEGRPRRAFAPPEGVERVRVCPRSGRPVGPHCPRGRREPVATAHRPAATCDWHGPDGLRVPPEAFAHGVRGAPAGDRVAILAPADGATVVRDPVLPATAQRVVLRVAPPAGTARVRWEVDGRVVAEPAAPFEAFWAPSPGPHRIRAVAETERGGERASAPIEITVDEPGG